MSHIKKALELAAAERLAREGTSEAPRERPTAGYAMGDAQIRYTRTRVVSISAVQLAHHRLGAAAEGTPLADQFKRLRTRILQETRPRKWNTIQVTGFGTNEGKSLIAANLAISLAQDTRQTTVLVDLNFRHPTLATLFGLELETPGLTAYFFENEALENLFINPGIAKLTLLPAGHSVVQSTELVGSPRMEQLIKELKTFYNDRYVVLDTPGIGTCADPLVIAEYVDAVLLVARADQTTQASITAAMSHLRRDKLLGVVLNDVASRDMMAGC